MFLFHATNTGGKLLLLKTELIQVLEKTKQLIVDDGQNPSLGDVLLELYRNRDGKSARAALIDKALAELGVETDALNQRLDDWQKYLVEFEDKMEPLLQRLGTPVEPTEARVGYCVADHGLNVGEIALLVGGDAHAEISIGSYTPPSLPEGWTGSLSDGRALQELAIGGKIAINGSGQSAWNGVNANVSAAVSTSARIRLYHEFHADRTRIEALALSASNWAPPWDLSGLSEQLKCPKNSGFRRVLINGAGRIQFAGSVGVGYAASFDRDVPTPDGTVALGAAAKLESALDVSFDHHGAFRYQIEKDADGNLLISVERASSGERAVALNLDASLQIDGLDEVSQRYARSFFKDPEGLLDSLQKWTRPGDLLVDALKDVDWDLPAVNEIGELLLGKATAGEISAVASEKLRTMLARELNQALPFWSLDSTTIAQKILDRIGRRLDVGAEIGQQLRQELQTVLVERISQVREELEGEIQRLLDTTENVGTELLDPLEHVGIEVKAIREQANSTATELLAPVIKYLQRYEAIRLRLMTALEQTARFKLGMNIGASLSRSRTDKTLLSFRVKKVTAETRAVHRAFLLGRMGQAWAQFEAARQAKSIDQIDGLFSFLTQRERKIGFALHFGELGGIERTRVKSEDVQFQVDPSGNILAANAKLSQEAVVRAFHVERSIGVVGSYDLVAAMHDHDQMPCPLAFNIGYEDKKLRSKELRQFMESLEDDRMGNPLISPGAADTAVDSYQTLLEQNGVSRAEGRIDLAIPISIADLASLVHLGETLGDDVVRRRAVEVQLRFLPRAERQHAALRELADGYRPGMDVAQLVAVVSSMGASRASREMADVATRIWGGIDSTSPNSPLNQLVRTMLRIGRNATALVQVVEGIRAIAALQQKLAQMPKSPLAKDIDPLRKPIDQATRQINDGLEHWLKARGVISGLFTEALPEQTLALLALLSQLSVEQQPLMPVVKIEGVENGLILVA